MNHQSAEETFGRSVGGDTYIELIMSHPELLDKRVIDIARESAKIALSESGSRRPQTDRLVPALVTKAIVGEIEDQTFGRGRFEGHHYEAG